MCGGRFSRSVNNGENGPTTSAATVEPLRRVIIADVAGARGRFTPSNRKAADSGPGHCARNVSISIDRVPIVLLIESVNKSSNK